MFFIRTKSTKKAQNLNKNFHSDVLYMQKKYKNA